MPPAFEDKTRPPADADLKKALGRSFASWRQLLADLSRTYAPLTATWKFPGRKYGWTLQLKREARSVFYMTPHEKHFVAATAFGEKAVALAKESALPAEILTLIDEAPRFAEGRAIRLSIRKLADLAAVRELAEIKMLV